MKKSYKTYLVALCGALIAGAAAAHLYGDHHRGKRDGGRLEQLVERLDLTSEQAQSAREIFEEKWEKHREIMRALRRQARPQMEALHQETRQRLAAVFSEEQLQEYDEMHKERCAERHAYMKKRRSKNSE